MNVSASNARVVITGATGIVGQRLALGFAQEGSHLYLVGHEETSSIVEEARKHGAKSVAYRAIDLRQDDQVMTLCAAIERDWGGVDVLVNNAGLYPLKPLLAMSVEDWDTVMAINLRAPFLLSREIAKSMIQAGVQGSIINISSGAALRAKVGHGHYSTSKAGLEMLTRSFAIELAPFHIRVNAIRPGFAPGSDSSYLPEEYVRKMTESIPLGRVSGEWDAPAIAVFLASSQATFITGATFTVDGGRGAGTISVNDRESLLREFGIGEG